jgi:G:T-mismatch repair DNA endonuclease (very short patch repair protein)
MNLCECGCGQSAPISPYNSKRDGYIKGQPRRFIIGHNRRGKKCFEQSERMILNNPMKLPEVVAKFIGKKNPSLSERNRKQTGKNNPCFGRTGEKHPMWGKKRPDLTKRMTENNPMKRPEVAAKRVGEGNPMFGRKRPEIGELNRKRIGIKRPDITGENNPNKRPEVKAKLRKRMQSGGAAYANSFNKNPSKPQVQLYEMVKLLYPSAILNYLYGKYCIDIAIPEPKIAIEYDGSYWHQDKEKDVKRQKELEERGWRFIRYKDHIPTEGSLIKDICQD